jgi:flagellar protein FlgJ
MMNIDQHGSRSVLSPLSYVEPTLASRSGHPDVNFTKSQDAVQAHQQLVQVGQQFEAYFISYLLKVMRDTVPEGAFANKQGAYFYSFYDEEIGKRAAESGGIGIAKMVQEYAQQYFSSSPAGRSSSGE